jgi:hypothetical protein
LRREGHDSEVGKGAKMRVRTGLSRSGSLVTSASERLLSLLKSRLLGVRGDLLLGLLSESLAAIDSQHRAFLIQSRQGTNPMSDMLVFVGDWKVCGVEGSCVFE